MPVLYTFNDYNSYSQGRFQALKHERAHRKWEYLIRNVKKDLWVDFHALIQMDYKDFKYSSVVLNKSFTK